MRKFKLITACALIRYTSSHAVQSDFISHTKGEKNGKSDNQNNSETKFETPTPVGYHW